MFPVLSGILARFLVDSWMSTSPLTLLGIPTVLLPRAISGVLSSRFGSSNPPRSAHTESEHQSRSDVADVIAKSSLIRLGIRDGRAPHPCSINSAVPDSPSDRDRSNSPRHGFGVDLDWCAAVPHPRAAGSGGWGSGEGLVREVELGISKCAGSGVSRDYLKHAVGHAGIDLGAVALVGADGVLQSSSRPLRDGLSRADFGVLRLAARLSERLAAATDTAGHRAVAGATLIKAAFTRSRRHRRDRHREPRQVSRATAGRLCSQTLESRPISRCRDDARCRFGGSARHRPFRRPGVLEPAAQIAPCVHASPVPSASNR